MTTPFAMAISEAEAIMNSAELLYSAAEIEAALDRMAIAITTQLQNCNPLLLCVMVGGLVTAGRLLPRLAFPLHIDYLHATRYQGGPTGGELRWIKHPDLPMQGRTILIIDDILDEGVTLAAIVEACKARGAIAVHTAVLVEKNVQRPPQGLAHADFVGLRIDNRFIFGYGMDVQHYHRNANGIFALKSS